MIILQLALYCVLFTLMVKIAVGNNALNGLCFYPKPVPEKVYELGLTHPIRTNLGSGPEETRDPDTDLDRCGRRLQLHQYAGGGQQAGGTVS